MTGFRGTSSWQKYLKWVEDNPGTATDIEKALKWISYIISGEFGHKITIDLCSSER